METTNEEDLLIAGEDLSYGQRLQNNKGIITGFTEYWSDDRPLWKICGYKSEKQAIDTIKLPENIKEIVRRNVLYHTMQE